MGGGPRRKGASADQLPKFLPRCFDVWTFSARLNVTTNKKRPSTFFGKKVHRQIRKSWLRVREKGPRLTLVWGPRMVNPALHGALTANFGVGCSSCSITNSFVTNAELIEKAVSCWHLHQLISQTTHYLDSWLSDLLQSEIKRKLLEIEGRGDVPQCPTTGDATDCNISV